MINDEDYERISMVNFTRLIEIIGSNDIQDALSALQELDCDVKKEIDRNQ